MDTYIETSSNQKCPICNSLIEFICNEEHTIGERCSTCKWEMSFEDGEAVHHPFGTLHKEK